MRSEHWLLLVWLGVTTVALVDAHLMLGLLGARLRPAQRVAWWWTPLLVGPIGFLLTPWRAVLAFLLSGLVALHLARHLIWWRRTKPQLQAAPDSLCATVGALCQRWSTREPDQILLDPTDRVGPAVVGFWQQSLVVPSRLLALPTAEQEAILAHELAHLRRRDPLRLMLASLLHSSLAWHPLARRFTHGLRVELEMAADAQAVDWVGDMRSYSLALGHWALGQVVSPAQPSVATLIERPGDLVLRLRQLESPQLAPHLVLPRWAQRTDRTKRKSVAPRRRHGWLPHLVPVLGVGYLALFSFLSIWL